MILLTFLLQTLRLALPLLFAAAGGVMSERVGIIALTLEGFMLTGAFCGALGAYYSGSAVIGLMPGVAGATLASALLGVVTVRYRANQVVSGIAVNLLAVGATTFFLRLAFDSSSNSPRIPGFGREGAGVAAATLTNPLVWMGVLALPAVWFLLFRTTFGLRVRAVGEHPEAATTAGVNVDSVRYAGVLLSGALAGLAGVYLAMEQHQFTNNMTAGRGFIALAAVIFGRWMPMRVAAACILFAAADSLSILLGQVGAVPQQFVSMIPFVLTIIAVAGIVGRSVAPAALGRADA